MINLPSYALFDKCDNVFLTVKHPTINRACADWGSWINNHHIAILAVYGTRLIGEIDPRTGYKLKVPNTDLVMAQRKYLPKQSAKYSTLATKKLETKELE